LEGGIAKKVTYMTKYNTLKTAIVITLLAYLALFGVPNFISGFIQGLKAGWGW
jgi:hypothetical protein